MLINESKTQWIVIQNTSIWNFSPINDWMYKFEIKNYKIITRITLRTKNIRYIISTPHINKMYINHYLKLNAARFFPAEKNWNKQRSCIKSRFRIMHKLEKELPVKLISLYNLNIFPIKTLADLKTKIHCVTMIIKLRDNKNLCTKMGNIVS